MNVVVAKIGGDALQPANRDGFAIDAAAAAGGLARPVTGAAEYPRKDVRLPVEQIRFRVPALRDEPDVLRHVRMRPTHPLAIDDLVVILGIADVGGHALAAPRLGGCRSGFRG